MKKIISILLCLFLISSQILVFATENNSQGSASAHVYTFEELTGLSREDIDHISICNGVDGIFYSTTYDKIITDIYNTINTKSFVVDMSEDIRGGFGYKILFFDSNDTPYNMAYTYTIPHGIVIKEKDGLTYRTSNEEELKNVVEKSYNLIADIDTEEINTFEELAKLSAEDIEKISIACSKDGRTEFSTSSPYIISNILYDFKDIKFIEDTRDGSAGGWLYNVNYYLKDGTYIQFGARIHIDKADYIAIDCNKTIEKMAYYHDLMKNVDSSEWATDYILECKERGFLEGVTDISYKEPITREKFCEIIYNMLDRTMDIEWKKVSPNPFVDTTNEKVFSLCLEEIINGKDGRTFAPNDYLTREEAATIIVRVVNKFMPMPVHEVYFEYDDISEVSEWASNSIQIISNLGVMNGVGDNKFAPQDTYTTEQAIATVIRLYNNK